MAQGTTKPSTESISNLTSDLSAALAARQVSKSVQIKLFNDIEQVLNSANIPMSEMAADIKNAQEILIASVITRKDIQIVASDLKAIAEELKRNLQTITDQKK